MSEGRDPLAELREEVARVAHLRAEIAAAEARIVLLAQEVVRRGEVLPPVAPSKEQEVPEFDQRLSEGTQEDRTRVYVEIVAKLKQPFSPKDAAWFTKLPLRTVVRHNNTAIRLELVEEVARGQYKVVTRP